MLDPNDGDDTIIIIIIIIIIITVLDEMVINIRHIRKIQRAILPPHLQILKIRY